MTPKVVQHLAELPGLAARTAPATTDRDPRGGGDSARYVRPDAGPRLCVTPTHADSWADAIGYLALGAEVAGREAS
jgi:hypothetical protein